MKESASQSCYGDSMIGTAVAFCRQISFWVFDSREGICLLL